MPSDTEILNFTAIGTVTQHDILNPRFVRTMANIIKSLNAGYSQVNWSSAYQTFLEHIANFNNPHLVNGQQIVGTTLHAIPEPTVDETVIMYYLQSIYPDVQEQANALLNTLNQFNYTAAYMTAGLDFTAVATLYANLYARYVQTTTTPVDQPTFEAMLLSTYVVATADGLIDPSQSQAVVSASLLNAAYTQHQDDPMAHPLIQAMLQTDPVLDPVFCLDPTSGSFGFYPIALEIENGIRSFGSLDVGYPIKDVLPPIQGTILCKIDLFLPGSLQTLSQIASFDENQTVVDGITLDKLIGTQQIVITVDGAPLVIIPASLYMSEWLVAITYQGTALKVYQFTPEVQETDVILPPWFMTKLTNYTTSASLVDIAMSDVVQLFLIYDQVLSLEQIQCHLGIPV